MNRAQPIQAGGGAPNSPTGAMRWLPYRNDSGEEIPAFAVLRITGVTERNGQALLTVAKPNSTAYAQYAINGSTVVPANGYGRLTFDTPAVALYDSGLSPSVGDLLGPEDGEWALTTGGNFMALGGTAGSGSLSRLFVQATTTSSTRPIVQFKGDSLPLAITSATYSDVPLSSTKIGETADTDLFTVSTSTDDVTFPSLSSEYYKVTVTARISHLSAGDTFEIYGQRYRSSSWSNLSSNARVTDSLGTGLHNISLTFLADFAEGEKLKFITKLFAGTGNCTIYDFYFAVEAHSPA